MKNSISIFKKIEEAIKSYFNSYVMRLKQISFL